MPGINKGKTKMRPLRQHIVRIALIGQVVIFTLLYFVLDTYVTRIIVDNYIDSARSSALEASESMLRYNSLDSEIDISVALDDMMLKPKVVYAEIIFNGKHYLPELISAHSKSAFVEDQTVFEHGDQTYYLSMPFDYDEKVAFLSIGYDEITIQQTITSSRQAILVSMLLAALVSFIFIYLLSSRLTKPLLMLAATSKEIAAGAGSSESKLKIKTQIEELSVLSNSIEDMHLKLMSRNRRLKHLASTDALTGIPNRLAFSDFLSKEVSNNNSDGRFALLMIDVNKFKEVNDSYGHVVGDHVINEIAKRLNSVCREKDLLARIGGDEFAIVLHNASEGRVQHFCRLLNQRITESIHMNDLTLKVSVSVGATLIDNVLSIEDAIHQADMAMYESKRQHEPFILFGMQSFGLSLRENLIKKTLKSVLIDDKNAYSKLGLYVLYQPKFDAHDFKLTGVEALLRWDHAEFGSIPTEQLVSIAESESMISGITDYVLHVAAEQARDWKELGHALPVSVNISALDLQDQEFEQRLLRVYERYQIPYHLIELEISEQVLAADVDKLSLLFNRLKQKGIPIVVDGFGRGDIRFQSLSGLPLQSIKIDRSYIMVMLKSEKNQTQVESLIKQTRLSGLKVIAEGVESESMIKVLSDAECDEVQGFHFSRPVQASFIENNFLNEL